jgi:hypothetical protein
MTEARLVTREQLAAALHGLLNIETGRWNAWQWNDPDAKTGGQDVTLNSSELAAAIFAALPAAAPAEGLREARAVCPKCGEVHVREVEAALARHESGSE